MIRLVVTKIYDYLRWLGKRNVTLSEVKRPDRGLARIKKNATVRGMPYASQTKRKSISEATNMATA